jgi:hypothetical protein
VLLVVVVLLLLLLVLVVLPLLLLLLLLLLLPLLLLLLLLPLPLLLPQLRAPSVNRACQAPSSLTSLNLDGFALPVRKLRGGNRRAIEPHHPWPHHLLLAHHPWRTLCL